MRLSNRIADPHCARSLTSVQADSADWLPSCQCYSVAEVREVFRFLLQATDGCSGRRRRGRWRLLL